MAHTRSPVPFQKLRRAGGPTLRRASSMLMYPRGYNRGMNEAALAAAAAILHSPHRSVTSNPPASCCVPSAHLTLPSTPGGVSPASRHASLSPQRRLASTYPSPHRPRANSFDDHDDELLDDLVPHKTTPIVYI